MQTVVETPVFIRSAAQAKVSEAELDEIRTLVAENPTAGDAMPGTGGARKLRFAARGKGKSGVSTTVCIPYPLLLYVHHVYIAIILLIVNSFLADVCRSPHLGCERAPLDHRPGPLPVETVRSTSGLARNASCHYP